MHGCASVTSTGVSTIGIGFDDSSTTKRSPYGIGHCLSHDVIVIFTSLRATFIAASSRRCGSDNVRAEMKPKGIRTETTCAVDNARQCNLITSSTTQGGSMQLATWLEHDSEFPTEGWKRVAWLIDDVCLRGNQTALAGRTTSRKDYFQRAGSSSISVNGDALSSEFVNKFM